VHPAEDRSVEDVPVFVDEKPGTPAAAHPGAGFRRAGSDGGGVEVPNDPLAEDTFPSPAPGAGVYAPEVGELPGGAPVPGRSTFGALYGAFDEPGGGFPVGVGTPEGRVSEEFAWHYPDVEAFADLVNEVLVRQARRHGVDLS